MMASKRERIKDWCKYALKINSQIGRYDGFLQDFDDCLMLVLGHVAKYLATLCFIKGKKQKGGHFITNENFLNENLM